MNAEQHQAKLGQPEPEVSRHEPAPSQDGKAKRQSSPITSFRLEPDEAELLSERAARLGVSSHELARHYVVEALVASEELAAIGTAVNALLHQMHSLRQDLALSVEALLASAGEVSEKQAHAWVEASLNRH
jgi:hypothetical protein